MHIYIYPCIYVLYFWIWMDLEVDTSVLLTQYQISFGKLSLFTFSTIQVAALEVTMWYTIKVQCGGHVHLTVQSQSLPDNFGTEINK